MAARSARCWRVSATIWGQKPPQPQNYFIDAKEEETMNEAEYIREINKLRNKFQKSLNNIHIWSSVAIDALEQVKHDEDFLYYGRYSVPSSNSKKKKIVEREPEEIQQIIANAQEYELYFSVFVYLVAQVEAFLNDVLFLILRYDNRRVKTTIQGIEFKKQVDISEIIDSSDKESLIDTIIKRNLIAIFYASPAKQLDYLSKVSGIVIDESLQADWIEYKATRDIIVHNSGKINDLYLQKCGNNARGKLDEQIIVDKPYFENAIGKMKAFIGKVTNQLKIDIKEKQEVEDIV
jgi:hypothetical protein